MKKCLKCGHENPAASGALGEACPACGAIYAKVEAAEAAKAPAEPTVQPPKNKRLGVLMLVAGLLIAAHGASTIWRDREAKTAAQEAAAEQARREHLAKLQAEAQAAERARQRAAEPSPEVRERVRQAERSMADAAARAKAREAPGYESGITQQPMFGCRSEDLLKEMAGYAGRNDRHGAAQLLRGGHCVTVPKGAQTSIISLGLIRTEARFEGVKLWLPTEAYLGD